MNKNLRPVPHRGRRIVILVAMSFLALIGTTSWPSKIFFIISMVFVLGTYRRFRVTPESLMQRWTVAFVDLKPKRFKFKRFDRLEVKHEAATSFGEMLLFGGVAFIFGWVLDLCFPWLGGTYQIWLTRDGNNQELAWQGNSQRLYEENLELMRQMTGFETVVR